MPSPSRVIVIASTPRTGSTLLAEALAETGRAGQPREYLNPDIRGDLDPEQTLWDADAAPGPLDLTLRGRVGRIRRRLRREVDWSRTAPHQFSRRGVRKRLVFAAAHYASADGTFAIKLIWHQFERVMLDKGLDVSVWDAPPRWIWVRRTDVLRQAVSLVRARQTGRWRAHHEESNGEKYDADRIDAAIGDIRHWNEEWTRYFAARGIEPLMVTYEELDTEYDATLRRTFSYLQLGDLPVPPQPLDRQADQTTEEWVDRYIAERGAPMNDGAR